MSANLPPVGAKPLVVAVPSKNPGVTVPMDLTFRAPYHCQKAVSFQQG